MVPDGAAAALLGLGSATVAESGGRPMHPRIRAAWPGAVLAAPAFAVSCAPADNLAVHVALVQAPPGSALVVAASPPERGYWGEMLTTAAEARGMVGLVIDGGVRDVAAIESHGFPVFSTTTALLGAAKVSGGEIGGIVRVGDVDVATGDWLVADRDGVAVVAAVELAEVITRGRIRAQREAEMFASLRAGATTLELLDLDPGSVRRRTS